jgi:hypothetical protein
LQQNNKNTKKHGFTELAEEKKAGECRMRQAWKGSHPERSGIRVVPSFLDSGPSTENGVFQKEVTP